MNRLPQNLEAERWVLGAMLLDNQVIDDVSLVVRPDDFYADGHQVIFKTILELREQAKPATAITVTDALGPHASHLEYAKLVEETLYSVPHSLDAVPHAHIVRDKALKREAIYACDRAMKAFYADSDTATDLIERFESEVFALSERHVGDGTVEAVIAVDESIDRTERRVRNPNDFTGIVTGYQTLDEMLDGFQPGQLIVLAARPSIGKTAIALSICANVAIDFKKSIQLFSLEMTRKEIGDRLISSRGEIDGKRLKEGHSLNDRDRQKMRAIRAQVASTTFGIDDTASRTISQIAACSRRRANRHGLSMVVIDYLQLIETQPTKNESRQDQVAKLSRRLKILAKELKCPIMVLSQLNRESEKREDKRPRLAELRESGAIEQDADIVLLLHRPDFYDPKDNPQDHSARKAELIVAKNRNGPTGTIVLDFHKPFTLFTNAGELDAGDFGPCPPSRPGPQDNYEEPF